MVNDAESSIGGFPTAIADISQLPNSFPWPPTGHNNQYEHSGFALDTLSGAMQGGALTGPFDAQWDVGYVASYHGKRRPG
jgi:hypothetical protein